MAVQINYCLNQLGKIEKMEEKKYNVGKIMPCQFFQVSLKKLSSTQVLASEKLPKKYTLSDATVPIALKFL